MTASLVSVIVPCHNAARWLPQSIQSALAQTWPAVEVIVIDDGSTDESAAVAQPFVSRGVRLLQQPNRGAAAARNAGLRAARGDYIQFLDADDLLGPDKIERQLALLDQAGPRALSSSAWARFRDEPSAAVFQPEPNWRDLSGVEFLVLHYEQGCMMQPAAWLAPRDLLERVGPWDESLTLNDDGEYFARAMLASDRILFCESARSYYRTGASPSLSGRRDRVALESLYRSVELTTQHLLRAEDSARTRAAAAHAWKWTAFELYPEAPGLADRAENNSRALGGSARPFPAGGRFQALARIVGWRLAKRLAC